MYSYNNSSTIYVSQKNGDDTKYNGLSHEINGYGNGPFKTVEKALEAVGELRVTGNRRPMEITFCDDYYISKPICVGQKYLRSELGKYGVDSVSFTSYCGRKRIIGGIKVEGWIEDTFNGKPCFSAKLPQKSDGANWDFTDLYINGKRADLTRYPQNGTLKAKRTENDFGVFEEWKHLFDSSKWFDAYCDDLADIEGIEDAIVSYYHYWIDEHSPIESYDKETGRIVMKYASRFGITTCYENNTTHNLHYYLQNLPGFFSSKNEWYLDRKNGVVYYIPRDGVTLSNIEAFAPTAEKLFVIEGEEDNNICDIRIRNLELICTKGDYVSDIVLDPMTGAVSHGEKYGSDIQSVYLAEGAVTFRFAKRCSLYDCVLKNLGVHAVFVDIGCTGTRIENCIIDDIAAGGISIRGGAYGCEDKYQNSHNVVRGNKITWCGRRYAAGCGVLVCHSHDNEISENEISYLDYTGISVGWVWGYNNSNTYGNIIRRNHIHHIGLGNLSDMGGIYTLGTQNGTVIEENEIHDVTSRHYCGNGIYTDEGSSNILIERNCVYDIKNACFLQHYGRGNVVKNNILAFGGECVNVGREEMHEGAIIERNVMLQNNNPMYSSHYNFVISLANRDNIYHDISGDITMYYFDKSDTYIPLDEWNKNMGKSEPGAKFNDPEVQDAQNRNFSTAENSFAAKMGFEKIK